MINRFHRFHGYGGLRAIYQRGQTVRSPQLSLKFQSRDAKRPYRLAVVVSRKVSKSAVVRNRIRRRIFEVVRQQASSLPPGIDLMFTVFDVELANQPTSRLEAIINGLLQKALRQTSHSAHPERPANGGHAIVKTEGSN